MRSIVCCIIWILILLSCSEKPKLANTLPTALPDTIKRVEVKKTLDGDSVVEYQTITFATNDLNVPIDDSFYYEAMGRNHNKGECYRIYFDRKKVIAFCDSMLNSLGPETSNNFDDLQIYSAILENAQHGFGNSIFVSETHYIINRFRPLIINVETGHMPKHYFTIHRRSSEREDIEREFVTKKGDTFGLSWENIWIRPLYYKAK